jgi:hypothetical protein
MATNTTRRLLLPGQYTYTIYINTAFVKTDMATTTTRRLLLPGQYTYTIYIFMESWYNEKKNVENRFEIAFEMK